MLFLSNKCNMVCCNRNNEAAILIRAKGISLTLQEKSSRYLQFLAKTEEDKALEVDLARVKY